MKITTLMKQMKEHIGIKALATASFIILILLALAYLTTISYNEKANVPISTLNIWRVNNMSMMTALIPLIIGIIVLLSSIMLLSSNTTIRGTVLSVNLFASVLLVAGIFSPWINCAGMMGGSNAEQGVQSKTLSIPISAYGCQAKTDDSTGYTGQNCGTTGQDVCPGNINVQYVLTIESDGMISVCAYYNTDAFNTAKIDPTVTAEMLGSTNNSGEPSIDDDTLADASGNTTFNMFGATAEGGTYCLKGGHYVTDSLDAKKFDYIYIRAVPTKTCATPAVAVSANPIVKADKNKKAYQ